MNTPTQPSQTKERKPRLPRYRRAIKSQTPQMLIQGRDIEILKTIWEYRYLTSEHFLYLIKGSRQKIYQRLQKLFHNRYLHRLHFPIRLDTGGSSPAIYVLDHLGADLLVEHTGLPVEKVKWTNSIKTVESRYLKHALMISNFRAVLSLAIKKHPNLRLVWSQGKAIKDKVLGDYKGDKRENIAIVPDAYFKIIDIEKPGGEEADHFFLECDRATTPSKRFQKRMRGYWIYWGRGEGNFSEKYGSPHFRVLTVTTSEKRTKTLLATTKQADDSQTGSRLFWFTEETGYSLGEPEKLLGAIWKTAKTPDKIESILS